MKNRMKAVVVLGLALSLGQILQAHCGKCGMEGDHKNHEERMDKRMDHMSDKLGLTPEQRTQIEAIKNEKQEKLKALHEETQIKIKAVLTEEQKAKFEGMKCGPECKDGCGKDCKMQKEKCGAECKDGCSKECKLKKKKMRKEKIEK